MIIFLMNEINKAGKSKRPLIGRADGKNKTPNKKSIFPTSKIFFL